MRGCHANICFVGSKHRLNFPRRRIDRLITCFLFPNKNIKLQVFRSHDRNLSTISYYIHAELSNLQFTPRKKSNYKIFSIFERMGHANVRRCFHGQTRVVSRRMMICIKTRHFRFNRLLLLSIGLWPYERTKLVEFHVTLFFGILIIAIAYQVYPYLCLP